MDIQLIKNAEESKYIPLAGELLLQTQNDESIFSNRFRSKKMFLLNASTNERFEIGAGIKKYLFGEISYASKDPNYIYFVSLEEETAESFWVILYKYQFDNDEISKSYKFSMNKSDIEDRLLIFAIDGNYLLIEQIDRKTSKFKRIILHETNQDRDIPIENSLVGVLGAERIIPISGNNCVVKLGASKTFEQFKNDNKKKDILISSYALVDEADVVDEFETNEQITPETEIIGIVNIRQFISENSLNGANVSMERLDVAKKDSTFPYIKITEGKVVYSKFSAEYHSEKIVFYDYENDVKQVRLNNDVYKSADLSYTYIINDTPYMISRAKTQTTMLNLNNQKIEAKFGADVYVKFVENDLLVLSRKKHKIPFFNEGSNYIEVVRFPDIHTKVFTTKADYKYCISTGNNLLIFTP
ncbi:hypothetical protein [Lachnospira multipara]|uniref:Uncharacterized protein n=1 Tax=Lachnospira multipara TaxID=28051 RepID=A0A1H5RMQ8_9FIRM|nr:hypothetical protein [Lachnospira multipara]SEF38791.1 hypothetical protein SAMN05216537_10192 [Lachnospira multipara]